jgi:predicted NBD/HSP70 family sugar kinase
MIFVPVSTGVGGGLVLGGRLWPGATGLAGHVGHMAAGEVERLASGTALARRAREAGHAADARRVIAEAAAGSPWAERILNEAVAALVRMLADVKLLAVPALAVLGGGVGLNPDFRRAVLAAMAGSPAHTRLDLVSAQLGGMAGLVGAAALAEEGETGTKLPAANE